MRLREILEELEFTLYDCRGSRLTKPEEISRALDTEVAHIENDSRKVRENTLFFCIPGERFDGHAFAAGAAMKGAGVLLVERIPDEVKETDFSSLAVPPVLVMVPDARYAMAFCSAAFYGHPASRMKTIGVTGTKGKTTTTYLIRSILQEAGYKVGLVGTIETVYDGFQKNAENTTPESMELQQTFRAMADAGVQAVVMEVSSQALKLHRTQGFVFDVGVFTNLSPDHIGPAEHESFEDYLECKSRLFRQCRVGVVNGDDPNALRILEGHTCSVETFGLDPSRDLYAVSPELTRNDGRPGIRFTAEGPAVSSFRADGGNDGTAADAAPAEPGKVEIEAFLPGAFNAYNILCAMLAVRHFDVSKKALRKGIGKCLVKGRIELVESGGDYTLLIDYAHNAVALKSVLETLREYRPNRLVCLFGCGGNRSKLRRFEMGEVSGKLADLTIITSDNPRFEDPMAIIADIRTGIGKTDGKYVEIPDRKEAVRYAMTHAEPGDIVILAGKGHEDYQEIEGRKYPMDERVIIREILKETAGA